jgi:hypothetical protein
MTLRFTSVSPSDCFVWTVDCDCDIEVSLLWVLIDDAKDMDPPGQKIGSTLRSGDC